MEEYNDPQYLRYQIKNQRNTIQRLTRIAEIVQVAERNFKYSEKTHTEILYEMFKKINQPEDESNVV